MHRSSIVLKHNCTLVAVATASTGGGGIIRWGDETEKTQIAIIQCFLVALGLRLCLPGKVNAGSEE